MADYRQFKPVPIVCPHCGHVIGEQAYFESFEFKVANWLHGQVAPSATPGFDVWKCEPFPDLTFQVKYATAYRNKHKQCSVTDVSWSWVVKNPQPNTPDYFVLFGIHEDGKESVFLYSRSEYFKIAWKSNQGVHIRVSAKLKSDRQNYNYIPKIWRHEVKQPNVNLAESVRQYCRDASFVPNPTVRSDATSAFSEEEIPKLHMLYLSGLSQRQIGELYNKNQSFIGRVLRRTKSEYTHLYTI